MRYYPVIAIALIAAFCPACGCGHDKIIVKDERAPATTTVVQPAAPAAQPTPPPTVINNH